MNYEEEKKMLVDIARASIKANGPFIASETAPIVSLVYLGEKNDERILDVYIEEAYGKEEGVVVHSQACNDAPETSADDGRYFGLEEFSNDEIRAILKAVGIKVAWE